MLYLMSSCWLILVFILLCFALIMRKRLTHPMLLGICVVSFVISAFFPLRYVLSHSFLKEQVSVTALRIKNDASIGTDVVIQYIDSNHSERKIQNPIEGKWAWWNGAYKWSEEWERQGLDPTDTIVMEVPIGFDRYVTFSTGPSYGKVEIACMETTQMVDLYSEVESLLPVKVPDSYNDDYIKDLILRAAAFVGMEILVILLVTAAAVFLNRKTNWRVLLKWKYEAFVFLLSLLDIIVTGWYPNTLEYPVSYYFMPYENGFASRGLTGALTILFGGPYVKQSELTSYILVLLTLAYLFGSILIVKCAKMESDWRMGAFWVLLYLLTPFTFLQIFDDARPDIYLIILFLVGVILINKKRFLQLMPVICVVMLLFNETSCLFFVAPLLALLLYFFFREWDAGYFISFVSSATFTCITALALLRLDKGKLMSLDAFFAHMSMHTDVPINYAAFAAEYKDSNYILEDFAYGMGNQFHSNRELLVNTILYFIMLIPFVILFAILWKAVYKKLVVKYKDGGFALLLIKFLYWILLLASCGGVVCMLMAYDYLRFTEFIMIAALASMFTLIHREKLVLRINDLYLFTLPKWEFPVAPFAILLYMKFWGTIDVWPRNIKLLENLAQILKDFFGII